MSGLDHVQGDGLLPQQPVVVISGNYGSGKTEVSVNWALWLRHRGFEVTIADLDIVNPYFRCREAEELMSSAGIEVLAPSGEMHHAELPIIMPEIRGAIESPRGVTILDVGGDDDGARVLASMANSFKDYEMLQVVNQCRPFTDTVEGCRKIQREIEGSSRLRVTGLISNSHLMDETDEEVIHEGAKFAHAVGRAGGQILRFVTVGRHIVPRVDLESLGSSALVLDRLMLPPWRRPVKLGSDNFLLGR